MCELLRRPAPSVSQYPAPYTREHASSVVSTVRSNNSEIANLEDGHLIVEMIAFSDVRTIVLANHDISVVDIEVDKTVSG